MEKEIEKLGFSKYKNDKGYFWQKIVSQKPLIIAKVVKKESLILDSFGAKSVFYYPYISQIGVPFSAVRYRIRNENEIQAKIANFKPNLVQKIVVRFLALMVISLIISFLLAIF